MTPKLQKFLEKHGLDQEELRRLLQEDGEERGGGSKGAAWGRRRAAANEMPEPLGWSVTVEVEAEGKYGTGKVNMDIAFGPETFKDAPEIVQAMIQDGWNIYVRTPKKDNDYSGRSKFKRY